MRITATLDRNQVRDGRRTTLAGHAPTVPQVQAV